MILESINIRGQEHRIQKARAHSKLNENSKFPIGFHNNLHTASSLQRTTMSIERTSDQPNVIEGRGTSPKEEIVVVPEETSTKIKFLTDRGTEIIRVYGLKCKLDGQGNVARGGLNERETRQLVSLLRAFTNVEGLTKEMASKIRLEAVLRVVTNQAPGGNKFRFPPHVAQIAREAFDRYQVEGWGVDPNNELMDEPDGTTLDEAAPARRPSQTSAPTAVRQPTRTRPPPHNHLIYGENGIMRGIIVVRSGKSTSYRFGGSPLYFSTSAAKVLRHSTDYVIDPGFQRRSCHVEGHNGLTVGQWWPQLRCALRDGAHGASMKGIAGSIDRGADSVVISGAYDDLDLDQGDVVYYSGSDSHDNTDPRNPHVSKDTRAMRRAHELGKSLRVIRGSRSKSGLAPAVGFRYDGLYKIRQETVRKNVKGGAFIRFELVREPNQPAINLSHPTPRERKLFERVTDYY